LITGFAFKTNTKIKIKISDSMAILLFNANNTFIMNTILTVIYHVCNLQLAHIAGFLVDIALFPQLMTWWFQSKIHSMLEDRDLAPFFGDLKVGQNACEFAAAPTLVQLVLPLDLDLIHDTEPAGADTPLQDVFLDFMMSKLVHPLVFLAALAFREAARQ
jgi:hypothetical protein